MKKNSILKVLGIIGLLFVILSWIIPAGYFSNGEYIATSIMPVGLFDIIIYPFMTLTSSVFILMALDILLIGALYGVLNKTGFYSNLLDRITKKFKGDEKKVLLFTSILFVVLSSLTGLNLVLVIFVPLFATSLMLLGYSKFTSMMATIGGILVGNITSLYGSNIAGYLTYLSSTINTNIIVKIVYFIIVLALYLVFILKTSSNEDNSNIKLDTKSTKKVDIKLYTKSTKKVDIKKGVCVLSVLFILLTIGLYNWQVVFNLDLFDKLHDSIIGIEIGNFPLFKYLIGNIPALGHFTNYDLGFVLIVTTYLIGKLYKLSFSEIIDASIEGIKEMIPVALMVVIVNIIFLLMNVNSDGNTFFNTMVSKTYSDSIAYLPFGLITIIGSVLYNDFPYLLSTLYGAFAPFDGAYNLVFMITQTLHGIVQLLAPTSVILVIGLTYFDLPYTKWVKEIFKFALILLFISIIILLFI